MQEYCAFCAHMMEEYHLSVATQYISELTDFGNVVLLAMDADITGP